MLVEKHIEIADEMVALFAGLFRSDTVAPFLPGKHRFADMDASVIDDIGLHNLITAGLQNLCQRIAQQIVAHMPKVERLIGIGRRIFNHHQRAAVGSIFQAIISSSLYVL